MRCKCRISTRDLFERRSDAGKRGDVVGMEVAREHLGGDGRGAEAEARTNVFLCFGPMWAKVPTAPEIFPTRISSAAAANLVGAAAVRPTRWRVSVRK